MSLRDQRLLRGATMGEASEIQEDRKEPGLIVDERERAMESEGYNLHQTDRMSASSLLLLVVIIVILFLQEFHERLGGLQEVLTGLGFAALTVPVQNSLLA